MTTKTNSHDCLYIKQLTDQAGHAQHRNHFAAGSATAEPTLSTSFTQQARQGLKLEQSRREPPAHFPALPRIPAGRYLDAQFLRMETDSLWRNSWLYACHADELPATGSYRVFDRTGSAIVLVRNSEYQVGAFYNTCRHRGAPLVEQDRGVVKGGFTCPFHGWTYGLDGALKAVRDRRDFPGLDTSCLGLVPVRCESLGNWIFINENPAAAALADELQPVGGELAELDPDTIRHIHSCSFEMDCHYKVLLEGFFEVYHLHHLHSGTVDRFLEHHGTWIATWPRGHSVMVTPNRRPDWTDPGTIGMAQFERADELYRQATVSFNLFPNLVTPVSATGLPFLAVWPMGDASARLDCHWFAPGGEDNERHELWPQRIENFVRILKEDLDFVPHIQSSMQSAGFSGVLTGYQERRIYHWHEELDRRIGRDNIPPELRVEPLMAAMNESAQPG